MSFTFERAQKMKNLLKKSIVGAAIALAYSSGAFADATLSNGSITAVINDGGSFGVSPVYPLGTPGLSYNGHATQSLPHRSLFFNASYAYWKVGQYIAFSGYEKARQGGVLFCGEHTSQDFQGFMEGGASTGLATAKALYPLLK